MYRTIDTSLWTDPTVKRLPPLAKLLFIYLITNGHTHVSGLYFLPMMYVAHETGIPLAELDTLFDTLSGADLVKIDPDRELVWVVNMFKYQGPGEKHERGAANHLATLHNSPLINDFLKRYPAVRRFYRAEEADGVSDTPSLRSSSREGEGTEKEQEREPDGSSATATASSTRKRKTRGDVRELGQAFRERWQRVYPDGAWIVDEHLEALAVILDKAGGDTQRAIDAIDRYLADRDNWLVQNHHPIKYLRKNFTKYSTNGTPRPVAAGARDREWGRKS